MIDYAVNVFKEEASAILNLINYLDESFELAVKAIINSKGRVIITGIGKSGIIGKKISTTLASTGTPSFFLHPSEAYHGDLGMITRDDIIIAITNSGETDEVLKLVPFIKDNKNLFIAITGNPESTLAKNSDLHLNIHVDREVCPLNLTPTSSSTTTLVMGDALVVALIRERNFKPKDYARFHPGGSLGKRLLLKMEDLISIEQNYLPKIKVDTEMLDIVHCISQGGYGLAVVVDSDDLILGIITDGDIRRTMKKSDPNFFALRAMDVMKTNPTTINKGALFGEAEMLFKEKNINSLLIEEFGKLLGIVSYKQLMNK